MEKEIRFAAIPKCASRSLAALGLLGELCDKRHSKITEYPDWELYEWYYVDRDPTEWYRSWWLESHSANSAFARALGMDFKSMDEDLKCLSKPKKVVLVEKESGVNEWVPPDFSEKYDQFLSFGLGLKEFCFGSIIDGVPCKQVHISRLDSWLVAHGFTPVHNNVKQAYGGLSREEYLNPHPDLLNLARQLTDSRQLPSFMAIVGEIAMAKPSRDGVLNGPL